MADSANSDFHSGYPPGVPQAQEPLVVLTPEITPPKKIFGSGCRHLLAVFDLLKSEFCNVFHCDKNPFPKHASIPLSGKQAVRSVCGAARDLQSSGIFQGQDCSSPALSKQ